MLEDALEKGVTKLDEKTFGGQTQWHVPRLGLVLVTKATKQGAVVVTVLGEDLLSSVRKQKRVSDIQELAIAADEPSVIRLEVELAVELNGNLADVESTLVHAVRRAVEGIAKDYKTHKKMNITDVVVRRQ
jgi:hypothetical protein